MELLKHGVNIIGNQQGYISPGVQMSILEGYGKEK
jgi:hypothetical protein